LVESKCHLDVIERAFNNKPHTIDWKRDTEDESLEGTTTLNCYSVISEDGKETIVTISLGKSDLHVKGVKVDSDNIILTSDSNTIIVLDSDMNGKGTITIRASQYENGKSCELIENITIEFKNGEPSYTFATPQISFRDDSYKINRYLGSWLKEKDEEDNTVVTGCYTISGKKDSEYHGIKGEDFEGKLNICSPKINGVLLDVESVEIDGEAVTPNKVTIGDLTLTTAKIQLHDDSSNEDDSFIVDGSNDENKRLHEIAKPIPVNIKLKKNDWTMTDKFDFYRNINDDDMVNETQDVFELNVSRPYGDFSWKVYPLDATTVDLSKSIITDATDYDDLGIEKTPNEVKGTCAITPSFNATTYVDETVNIKDSIGELEVNANFGTTLTINGVELITPDQSYSDDYKVRYDEDGNVYSDDEDGNVYSDCNVRSISFSDTNNRLTLTVYIKVSGNVTDVKGLTDNPFKCEITNLNFAPTIESFNGNFTIPEYTNVEYNKEDFGTDTSFVVKFSFKGIYGKTSKLFLNFDKDSNTIYTINGLEVKNAVVDIKMDENGNLCHPETGKPTKTFPFNFWDSLELVSIKGNLVLSSNNIKDKDNITISSNSVEVHAKRIEIEEEAVNATGETVSESF
jgi:hypothetical protein